MEKVLIIDKPKGFTSYDVVARAGRLFPEQKVGHAGTLDPLATGILIILIGRATKRQSEFMNLDKEYLAEIVLGMATDTYDAEGKIIGAASTKQLKPLNREKILLALKSFQGKITQTVPPYSAVKVRGHRLYQLARQGKIDLSTLPKRTIEIRDLKLIAFQPLTRSFLPRLKLKIICSKGTYIRSLTFDLGKELKVGAYLLNLKRSRVGPFTLKNAAKLANLNHYL